VSLCIIARWENKVKKIENLGETINQPGMEKVYVIPQVFMVDYFTP
jgi:hypothetical protein